MQAGRLGPAPCVFALEGGSLGIWRSFSFCLKALYGGIQSGCWPWCAVFGLGAAPAHLSLPVFPCGQRGRRCPWVGNHGCSAAAPAFPSDSANLLGRGVKVLRDCLWSPLKAAACPSTVQGGSALWPSGACSNALPCLGCHALIPALHQCSHPSPCSKAFPSVHLEQTALRQTCLAGLAAWQSGERHCWLHKAPW